MNYFMLLFSALVIVYAYIIDSFLNDTAVYEHSTFYIHLNLCHIHLNLCHRRWIFQRVLRKSFSHKNKSEKIVFDSWTRFSLV